MTMITPSYLGETIEYSSLHACRSTLEDPTEIQNSLIDAGLRIDFWHEFPVCFWRCVPYAQKSDDGYWRIPGDPIPLLFSLKATKPLK